MKKLILTMAAVLSLSSFAFANQTEPQDFSSTDDIEFMDESNLDIDIDFRFPGGNHGRKYVCQARNMHGQIFSKKGYSYRETLRDAKEKCERNSRGRCFSLGCTLERR